MIRINLLGLAKKVKKGRRAAVEMEFAGEGPSNVVLFAVGLVLAVLLNGGAWWYLDRQAKDLADQMTAAQREYQSLQAVEKRVKEKQALAESYQRRINVINELSAKRSGPIDLMNTIGDTVHNTEAVWLNSMSDEGSTINIEGLALSNNAVANLITNLKRTGYFQSVELKETFQDDTVKEMQAFLFTLACEPKKKT